jgi:hypothetical protein
MIKQASVSQAEFQFLGVGLHVLMGANPHNNDKAF